MSQDTPHEKLTINAEMTILDIVSSYRRTEAVFKQYDVKAGVCLCCEALFDPLKDVAQRYGLNLAELMADLENASRCDNEPTTHGRC
jgi:hypothetical protein